jgi:tetratricopeptide (TPR) repeat protein
MIVFHNGPQANHLASAGLGMAAARLDNHAGAVAAFRQAVDRAQALIDTTAEYYEAWYTLGLARTGLAALHEATPEGALAAYRRAVELAPHQGILDKQRRQLDELGNAPGVDAAVIAAARAVLAGDQSG